MATLTNEWHKPNVTIINEAIDIRDSKHSIKLGLGEVSKMYLSKNKSGYLSAMLGRVWLHDDSSYDLHIETKDEQEIKIRIKGFQRPYYIGLISRVRRRISTTK